MPGFERCLHRDTWLWEFGYDSAAMKPADSVTRARHTALERRPFLAIISGGLLVSSLPVAAAQLREQLPRVGYLSPGFPSDPLRERRLEAFRQGLRELGYVEGRNIAIESRWAEGKYDRYPALAADPVRSKVDVIVAISGPATQAVQQATRTIPIVMSLVQDPVGSGLVPSLAHPGGNVTEISMMGPDLVGKQLQMLKEVVPNVSRMAVLRNPANPASAPQLREAEAAARALGVRLQTLEARNPQEIDSAFAAMTRERARSWFWGTPYSGISEDRSQNTRRRDACHRCLLARASTRTPAALWPIA